MKEYLNIGELANIFNMDVQLLRHYDSKGLLVPTIRNPDNSRRQYHFDQVYQLATIRYLRALGYSLNRIKDFMYADDIHKNLDTMIDQSEQLRHQCEGLLETVDIIQKKLAFIDRECRYTQEGSFRIKTYPDRQFVDIGDEINLFTHELFYFYPTIGFYEGEEKRFGAYLFDEQSPNNTAHKQANQAIIPGGRYLCGYHYGPYQTIQSSIDRLYDAGKDYQLHKCVVTLNIIDQFVEGHPSNYITGLEVRIIEE